jgi:hypothetical protein
VLQHTQRWVPGEGEHGAQDAAQTAEHILSNIMWCVLQPAHTVITVLAHQPLFVLVCYCSSSLLARPNNNILHLMCVAAAMLVWFCVWGGWYCLLLLLQVPLRHVCVLCSSCVEITPRP